MHTTRMPLLPFRPCRLWRLRFASSGEARTEPAVLRLRCGMCIRSVSEPSPTTHKSQPGYIDHRWHMASFCLKWNID